MPITPYGKSQMLKAKIFLQIVNSSFSHDCARAPLFFPQNLIIGHFICRHCCSNEQHLVSKSYMSGGGRLVTFSGGKLRYLLDMMTFDFNSIHSRGE